MSNIRNGIVYILFWFGVGGAYFWTFLFYCAFQNFGSWNPVYNSLVFEILAVSVLCLIWFGFFSRYLYTLPRVITAYFVGIIITYEGGLFFLGTLGEKIEVPTDEPRKFIRTELSPWWFSAICLVYGLLPLVIIYLGHRKVRRKLKDFNIQQEQFATATQEIEESRQ